MTRDVPSGPVGFVILGVEGLEIRNSDKESTAGFEKTLKFLYLGMQIIDMFQDMPERDQIEVMIRKTSIIPGCQQGNAKPFLGNGSGIIVGFDAGDRPALTLKRMKEVPYSTANIQDIAWLESLNSQTDFTFDIERFYKFVDSGDKTFFVFLVTIIVFRFIVLANDIGGRTRLSEQEVTVITFVDLKRFVTQEMVLKCNESVFRRCSAPRTSIHEISKVFT